MRTTCLAVLETADEEEKNIVSKGQKHAMVLRPAPHVYHRDYSADKIIHQVKLVKGDSKSMRHHFQTWINQTP